MSIGAREAADSLNANGCRPFSRAPIYLFRDPGACAPGFMLSLAPRALLTPASQANRLFGAKQSATRFLRTPESAVERGLADRVAFARSGFTGRAAVATDPRIAVLIAIDIAARSGGKLRPASLEGPISWWRSRLRHAWSEEKNKENYRNG